MSSVGSCTSHGLHREPTDARVLAAIEYIRQRVAQPVSLPEVAGAAHLSPDRFRHLFVEETGMPLRTYLVWRRLLHVWTLLMAGETLYEIADLSRLWVRASVFEFEAPLIKEGQAARVIFPYLGNPSVDTQVTFLYPHIDPQTRC